MRGNKNVGGGIFRGREAPRPPGEQAPYHHLLVSKLHRSLLVELSDGKEVVGLGGKNTAPLGEPAVAFEYKHCAQGSPSDTPRPSPLRELRGVFLLVVT